MESFSFDMSTVEKYGNVKKSNCKAEFEWKIIDFYSVAENITEITCPTFLFADTSWYFQVAFRKPANPGFIVLFLLREKNLEFPVEYTVSLKKMDGSVEHLATGIFKEERKSVGPFLIHYSQVHQGQYELVPLGSCIIMCKLRHEVTFSNLSKAPELPKIKKLINLFSELDTLSENLKNLLTIKESCDTTLYVKDKEFKAHRVILMARSSVFKAMFLHETLEKQTGIVTIPDCNPDSFELFLEFVYSGKLEKPLLPSILHLYETSDKYDVQDLKVFCSEFLMKNLSVKHLCDIVILADKYEDKKLLTAAQYFFNNNLNNILGTSEWDCLMKDDCHLANKLLLEMSKMKDCK